MFTENIAFDKIELLILSTNTYLSIGNSWKGCPSGALTLDAGERVRRWRKGRMAAVNIVIVANPERNKEGESLIMGRFLYAVV